MPTVADHAGAAGGRVVRLPAAPVSARLARQHVTALTGAREDPRVALVVSELVTNAVVHGEGPPELRLRWQGPSLLVEVHDDSVLLPHVQPLDDAPAVSGRGMALVDLVADAWGTHLDPTGGKTVWALVTPSPVPASDGAPPRS